MTIQIDEHWKHCTIEDFMNLSQEEHRVIYAALEEYHFDIFGKYHDLDESKFNLLDMLFFEISMIGGVRYGGHV